MKEKLGKYALLVLVWAIVIGYAVCSIGLLRLHRAEHVVTSVDIEICDSTANGHLVSSRMVREWLLHSDINTIGVPCEEVNLAGIERIIAKNGFVSRVDTYVSYDGVLHIEVSQRRPMLRLRLDGYDTYVTESGFVFRSPSASALYVPVVTGGYKPPFPSNYEGEAYNCTDRLIRESQERIAKIEREKNPLYRIEDSLKERRKEIRKEYRISVKRKRSENDEEYEERVRRLRAGRDKQLRRTSGELRYNDKRIEAVTARVDAEFRRQKKLEKRYEDFLKLINFVGWLESESFWGAEIVQIVAETTPSGALELELVPRSGRFTILFGRIEQVEEKFDKLLHFYKDGLNKMGWDCYSTINVKYDGQVVCSK